MRHLLALALLCSGCATLARLDPPGAVPYAPLEVQVGANPHVLAASDAALRKLGFEVVRSDGSSVEALRSNAEDARDHARVDLAGTTLEIDFRTELRVDGAWVRADRVCASYRHVRERALARAILASAAN